MHLVDMHEPITTTVVATHAGLAVFGGIVHALTAHRSGKTRGFMDIMLLAIISSFAGVMFAILATHYFPHQMYLSHAAAGMGGFLGVEGLSFLALRVRDLVAGKIK